MKYLAVCIVLSFFISCASDQADPFTLKVKMEVTTIMTKEMAGMGTITKPVQVDNVKIEKVSKKDYYTYQWDEQDRLFKKFLEFAKSRNYPNLQVNKSKHDSVMAYLHREKTTASTLPEIYKVDYSLNTAIKSVDYTQQRTIFLDSSLHKVVADYNFLNPGTK